MYFIFTTITIPYPIEYREGVAQVMTQIMLKGGNPFSLEYQPLGMNNYGIVYNLVVYPFAVLFGNTLAVYRVVTFFFLLFIFLLTLKIIFKENNDLYFALAGSTIIVIALSGRGGLGAFPSAMGTFLFLAAVLIPFNCSFDPAGLLISALLSVLAYYTKPYFMLSFGIVASYLFLFVSKKRSLLYAAAFAFMFAIFYLIAWHFFQFYFLDTFLDNVFLATGALRHTYIQLVELVDEFYPVIILVMMVIFLDMIRGKSERPFKKTLLQFNILIFDQSLVSTPLNYFAYFLICSTLTFIFVLGPHGGAYMTYSYQIVIPPLCIWLFQKLNHPTRLELISIPLILFNIILLSTTLLNPLFLNQKVSLKWAKLYSYVDNSTRILNSPVIASAMIDHGMLPVDSGQTGFFYTIGPYPQNRFLGPDYSMVESDGQGYIESIDNSLKTRNIIGFFLLKGIGCTL